ncbi:MAG: choline dehydrogenase [Ilumatobacteraceae bacterium]
MNQFDVVIVGAGSAGCALAARLTENPSRTVLLLEAGADLPGPHDPLLDGAVMAGAADGHEANWSLTARLTAARTVSVPRGKVMGGSSTVNGGVFVRATPDDFDAWAALGNDEWSFPAVLPFLKRLESDLDFPGDELHGRDGPIPVARVPANAMHPISDAFDTACRDLRYPIELDKNGLGPPGCGPLPRNIVDGVRVNAAQAYINPNRHRANLTIASRVTARRVVFRGTRATGVEIERDGTIETMHGDEIVLCAGAVMSAHLLMVSGIGPAEQLRRYAVDVVGDLAGVGTQCRDHPQVFLGFVLSKAVSRKNTGIVEVALDTEVEGAPVSLIPYLSPMAELVPGSGASATELVLGVLLERATSPVEISLAAAEPSHPPIIDYHSLESAVDRTRMIAAVALGLTIVDSRAMRDLGLERTSPLPNEALDTWISDNVTTAVHLCSSAPMGPDTDEMAVVDQYCRVRGVEGLRVVDTSILPTAPSRGPAATAVLIGERASEFFDGDST